jgi:hypothetical protein
MSKHTIRFGSFQARARDKGDQWLIVCVKPRALHAVANATMEARWCFGFSAYGGNPSHLLSVVVDSFQQG